MISSKVKPTDLSVCEREECEGGEGGGLYPVYIVHSVIEEGVVETISDIHT